MYRIIIQYAVDRALAPKTSQLRIWAKNALHDRIDSAEVTIRIVGSEEMAVLNSTYRQKPGPTNVLSFPLTIPKDVAVDIPLLGDIVICAQIVDHEAKQQGKSKEAHWAHMIIHGILHLLGYDHESDKDAAVMEAMEIKLLQAMGFANPYTLGEDIKDYD